MLTNPIYYGDFYWKGILYNSVHEPIIIKELFDKVQMVLDRRQTTPRVARSTTSCSRASGPARTVAVPLWLKFRKKRMPTIIAPATRVSIPATMLGKS